MSDPSSGFLRFEVCEQVFALPMADLAGIRQASELAEEPTRGAEKTGPSGVYVASTSLASLFFNETHHTGEEFFVVVHTEGRMYVLRVDRVLAGTDMLTEERSELPSLLGAFDSPFTAMFRDANRWGLIIDAARLAGMIRQRYPDTPLEHIHEIG